MNKVFRIEQINKGMIHIILKGFFDSDSIIKFMYDLGTMVQNLSNVKIYYDLIDFEGFSESAKSIFSLLLIQNSPYVNKEAIFGLNDKTNPLFKDIIDSAERKNIKFFNNRDDALEWIKQ